ncbi:unnamed protein product [Rhizophagus irregularis]|uniref:Uncharacterized protein n=1 Tax=Rhizophagus irregularis TaxID=588596 RepID=A0A915YVU8_9GLOM|nr:unnamed protein product [Rhizophagus irregularis]
MIEEVGQEEVLEIWKVVDIQNRLDFQENIIGVYNNKFTDKGILSPKTVPILRKAIHMRTLYSHVWELAREQNDNKITTLLQIKKLIRVLQFPLLGSQRIPKTRGFYKCRVCNGIGYNTAFHKSAGNK